jgi:four helix bundle protein
VKERNNSYRSLIVWQKSMELVKKVYKITNTFPQEELFGLTSQIKRSVISIPSNIAEGKGRQTNKEFVQFLYIALGSLYELQTQMELAYELGFIDKIEDVENLMIEIEKMLNALIKTKRHSNE